MDQLSGHFVERMWKPHPGGQTRRERQGAPYRAFVPNPISEAEFLFPGDVSEMLDQAGAAVRRLNDSPPKLAALEALAHQLLREESLASSRIEGLDVGHRRLALANFKGGEQRDLKAADIVGCIRALEQAIDFAAGARKFSEATIKKLHLTLLRFGQDADIAGRLRDRQGWIGGLNPPNAVYVPPPETEVPRLLGDLCEFMQRQDLPAIAQAAIAHAQFENIHPFPDGNGRVGRCLIHALLRRRGLAPRYVPPISLVLAARSRQYFGGLTACREGNLDDWLFFFAQVTTTAAGEAERLAELIDKLQERWRGRFPKPPRSNATVLKVLSILPAHPILDVATVVERLGVSDVAAGQSLRRLEELRILREVTNRTRNRTWECPDLFNLADRFERELKSRAT